MKELFTKLTKSEVRARKKKFKKWHPVDNEKKNSEIFSKSFFGKRNLNEK
mgnify:CR=1 FL=1|jgi:hypothetical protein